MGERRAEKRGRRQSWQSTEKTMKRDLFISREKKYRQKRGKRFNWESEKDIRLEKSL